MAQRHSVRSLHAPRLVTFALSLAMVLAALVSMKVHLPAAHGFVVSHRLALLAGGYLVLAVGVCLPML